MTPYSRALREHLKNQSKLIARSRSIRHSVALDHSSQDYGFLNWKQALVHMARADEIVAKTRANFSTLVQAAAQEISKQRGYPFLLDERVGMRYNPRVPDQAQSLAHRQILLELFENLHAPTNLGNSQSARQWLRPILPTTKAVDILSNGRWRTKQLATAVGAAQGAEVIIRPGYRDLTRSDIRDEIADFLHALYSQSVRIAVAGSFDEALGHPGFRQFAGCALTALQGPMGNDLVTLLEHAHVTHWLRGSSGQLDRDHLFWNQTGRTVGLSTSTISGYPVNQPFETLSNHRPVNSLSEVHRSQLATLLSNITNRCPTTAPIQRALASIGLTLAGWVTEQLNDPAQARASFSSASRRQPVAFLSPAFANQLRVDLASLQATLIGAYDECKARTELLAVIRKLEKLVQVWLERTRDHWSRKTLRLEMDSIGLVAVDPKHEPYLEPDTPWRMEEFMGTSREANLVNAIRPHLFPEWKEEDEQEGYSFDIEDMDIEDSLVEHLNSLVFYRYVGPARTQKQFWKEVNDFVYFRPQHVWFKQELIG